MLASSRFLHLTRHWFALGVLCCLPASAAWGQRVQVEAIPGQPFGVARLTLPFSGGPQVAVDAVDTLHLSESDNRVHYPTYSGGRIRRLLGLDDQPTEQVTIYFLFRGDAPLNVTVHVPQPISLQVSPRLPTPRQYERQYARLLRQWWRQYSAAARQQSDEGDYRPIVQDYLTSMLGRRLALQPTLIDRAQREDPDDLEQTLQLLLGLEGLRSAAIRDTNSVAEIRNELAELPIPDAPQWLPFDTLVDEQVQVEAIASHVPEECFYIRFGRFSNYLWLNQLLEKHGGDIGRMITVRGVKSRGNLAVQEQLGLKQSALAEWLGDQVISDVAMIGRDTFLDDGAAAGILFQARNNALLARDLNRQRQQAFEAEQPRGATMEDITIDGHPVSFLSTADNRLRSYYAVDGNFHLVTTSRAIVERFFQAGAGQRSLADSQEFRFARSFMPTSRQDTVFVYFSSAFFHGLVSPQYQIELRRRVQAVTDLDLARLARLAATAEGLPADSVEQLVDQGFLPRGFGQRADGSGPVLMADRILDSRRGPQGYFVPIPDVTIDTVTRSEQQQYLRQAQYFQQNWRRMDPIVVGVQRTASETPGQEHLRIEAHIAPLEEQKYDWLFSNLGPPTTQRVADIEGNVISVQAGLRGGILSPEVPPHIMFLGIRDVAPVTDWNFDGLFKTLQILQTTPGYLGAWPKPGFLDRLPLGLAGETDPLGYSRFPLGLWRREWNGFSVVSFDPDLLAWVTPQLGVVQDAEEAQLRVHIGNLADSQLRDWLNALNYQRARIASRGNARLMSVLIDQLQVEPELALQTAQDLLGAELVCTLGGQYVLEQPPGQYPQWTSTAWQDSPLPPENYEAPLLGWFRGLDSRLLRFDGRLVIYTDLEMKSERGFDLRSLLGN